VSFPKRTSLVAFIVPLFLIVTGCELLNLGAKPPLCEDSSVQNYVSTVQENAGKILDAANRIGELLSRLENDPSLIDKQVWKSAFSDEVAKIFIFADETQKLQVPRKQLEIFHELLSGAFADYKEGVTAMEEALNDKDEQKLLNSVDMLLEGDQKFRGAQDELDSILGTCTWYSSSL